MTTRSPTTRLRFVPAFELFAAAGARLDTVGLVAVGHRVVHGGPDLYRPTLVDDALIAKLDELSPLAPLHNPPAVLGMSVARKVLSDLPHIAVFDTAFFHDLPPAAATYAIDRDVAQQWHIRRYGFHGTSHAYVSEQAAAFLEAPLESLSQIVLHLGNGASASAIVGGRPVETSMGLTPMEGLVMGTRSGDIDPGVITYLWRTAKMSLEDIESMLNRRSGVLGLGGEIDFRILHKLIESGDDRGAIGLRRVHPPAAQVHRRVPGAARQCRRHHVHCRSRGERRRGPPRRAVRYGGARHRTRRAPQRKPRQGRPPHLGRPVAVRPCWSSRPTRSWPSPAPACR